MIKLVIFDLDGVLIDSKPNMKFAWNMVRKKFNIKARIRGRIDKSVFGISHRIRHNIL